MDYVDRIEVERTLKGKTTPLADSDFDFGNIKSDYAATRRYLTYRGKAILPVTGEFHFSRSKRAAWEIELRKIKAQGLDGVSVYVFWNHHEKEKGKYDFDGDYDVAHFLGLCRQIGLFVVLRIGPWCHGEVRYGGFPDDIARRVGKRRDSRYYLQRVTEFWTKLYEQVKEFCDGKTIFAIQLENEYAGRIGHVATLKRIACEIGFKTPFFTMTAWPANTPDKRFMPMFGGYPEAPWTQNKKPLKPAMRFAVSAERGEAEIGEDLIGKSKKGADFTDFPYATCETGVGNQVTHHRRPVISDKDGYGVAFAHFASGVNWLGYYMYHGGRNPTFRPMQESRRTLYPNNYPIVDYDFQAPLSKDGDVRAHANRLRLMHLFIKSDESFLAKSETIFASQCKKPFVSMRTDGKRGYLFVSNYERGESSRNTRLITEAEFDGKRLEIPPIDVDADAMFYHPFGCVYCGERFDYISAQPICETTENGRRTHWFVKTSREDTVVIKNGKKIVSGETFETDGGVLRFLEREEAEKLYKIGERAVFSQNAIFEKDGVYAQLKEGQSARTSETVVCVKSGDSADCVSLASSDAKKLPYGSYPFCFGRRKYYTLKISPDLCKDADDAEITLGFSGLDLQLFKDGKIADDFFNTDGTCTFRVSALGLQNGGDIDVRACACTATGSGNVYNEIGLTHKMTELRVKSVKRIKILKLD